MSRRATRPPDRWTNAPHATRPAALETRATPVLSGVGAAAAPNGQASRHTDSRTDDTTDYRSFTARRLETDSPPPVIDCEHARPHDGRRRRIERLVDIERNL
jgi:hypothetical protein